MTQTLYYEKPVLLNRDQHRKRRIKPSTGFAFARRANSMFLAALEFSEACKEYAIVFTRLSGRVSPVVVLGLRNQENLYVDAQDRWTATYIPAFVRRYPFVLAELGGGQLGVAVDEAFAGLNDKEGEALFDAKGANTPFLQNALDFLQRFQAEHQRTVAFCRKLEELGLLVEMSARADLVDGRTFTVAGLLVVDEAKLLALGDDDVLALFRTGELHLLSMHLLSLSNLNKLVQRISEREPAAPMPPAPLAEAPAPVPAPAPAAGD
jgi:hypothetical protein